MNKYKNCRATIITICILMFMPIFAINSFSATSTLSYSISCDKTTAYEGDVINVTISLNGVKSLKDIDTTALYGINMVINYNPEYLSPSTSFTLASENGDKRAAYTYNPDYHKRGNQVFIAAVYDMFGKTGISETYDKNGDNKVDILTISFNVKNGIAANGNAVFSFLNKESYLCTIRPTIYHLDTSSTQTLIMMKGSSNNPTIVPPTDTTTVPPTDTTTVPPTDTTTVPPTNTTTVPPTNTTIVPPTNTTIVPPTDTTTLGAIDKGIANETKISASQENKTEISTATKTQFQFADITNHWARKDIESMATQGFVSGVGDNKFEPDRSITRAEFVTIIAKALGLKIQEPSSRFSDVNTKSWYSKYVETAFIYGIINGDGKNEFLPNNNITREQSFAIINRTMSKIAPTKANSVSKNTLNNFEDVGNIEKYFVEDVMVCVGLGIVDGKDQTHIVPKGNITRAETAVIIKRMLEKTTLE